MADLRQLLIDAKLAGTRNGDGYQFRSNEAAADTALAVIQPLIAEALREQGAVIEAEVGKLLADRDRLGAVIERLRPVVEYVSRGRSFVDVAPYPDAAARFALGALEDAEDIRDAERALADPAPNIPLADVIAEYGQPTQEGEPQ